MKRRDFLALTPGLLSPMTHGRADDSRSHPETGALTGSRQASRHPAGNSQDSRVQGSDATRTIRYTISSGEQVVTVPATIDRIASAWEAQNSTVVLLGSGRKLVATTRYARNMPLFDRLVPGIRNMPLSGEGRTLNMENLAMQQPQVLFVPIEPSPAQQAQLKALGVATPLFDSDAIPALRQRVSVTAEILGDDAPARARRYHARFENNIARVRDALGDIPPKQRVSIYHAMGDLFSTTSRPSLNQDWMDLAQVRNAAESWASGSNGRLAPASLEDIIAADPELIVTMRTQEARQIRQDPRWQTLRAVRNGRVHANPRGLFWWCRETPEVALQFLWLACIAYPEKTRHIDMRAETRDFYRDFYGLTLTDREVDDILVPSSGP